MSHDDAREPQSAGRQLWGNAKDVQRIFGMSYAVLKKLVKQGRIRSWKLGESLQSARLYRIDDIDELLLSEATGQAPVARHSLPAPASHSLPPPSSPACRGFRSGGGGGFPTVPPRPAPILVPVDW